MTNAGLGHWHHGDRSGGRQPVGFVVATGVITDVIEVTKDEWHRAKSLQARPSKTCLKDNITRVLMSCRSLLKMLKQSLKDEHGIARNIAVATATAAVGIVS